MTDVKQILVVDDHFEMLEFLRSMLETSNHDYQVLGVPSAEEGFFELRRTPFDLVITDVRLPGMSGFELVRRVKAIRPDIPIVMITAYSSTQGKREAESLGVYRYFQKPLDTGTLLAAVHTALYGEQEFAEEEVEPATATDRSAVTVAAENQVRARLNSLRSDTGAAQVVLADAAGKVIYTIGADSGFDPVRLAQIMARTLENSLLLADELQSMEPLMIQYQSGEQADLYSANIGRDYFVMLCFTRQARRGRIGTIWIFAQRAVSDLRDLLRELPEAGALGTGPLEPAGSEIARTAGEVKEEEEAASVQAQTEAEAAPAEEVAEATGEESPAEALLAEIDGSELAHLLENGEVEADGVDLDAFWEAAMSEEDVLPSGGLSLQEARERGLIPPDFDEPE